MVFSGQATKSPVKLKLHKYLNNLLLFTEVTRQVNQVTGKANGYRDKHLLPIFANYFWCK